jgi:hypothetical protein
MSDDDYPVVAICGRWWASWNGDGDMFRIFHNENGLNVMATGWSRLMPDLKAALQEWVDERGDDVERMLYS